MAYEYDIFISYKNNDQTNAWVVNFEKKLKFWLTQELGGIPPKIFFDSTAIQTGDSWPQKLENGIRQSKCLVCIWTPEYFRSEWCISEWMSFEARERNLNIDRLILPLRFHDGDFYPEEAKRRQSQDISNYSSTSARFWETDLYLDFETNILRNVAHQIAQSIANVPAFSDDFPIHRGNNTDLNKPTTSRLTL